MRLYEITGMTIDEILETVNRRGFLKGLGSAALAGGAALSLPSIAKASEGKTWTGSVQVKGTPEKNVIYHVTSLKKEGDILIVGSRRLGPSGISTAVRAIDCNNARWKYLEDDGVKVKDAPWSEFTAGSSAYLIALTACAGAKAVL